MQPHEKVGLVGANGAGKSTLLKVLAGIQPLDKGRIVTSNGLKAAYLPQEVVLTSERSIFDEAFTAFGQLSEWHEEEIALEKKGEAGTPRYAELHSLLADHEYGVKRSEASQVLMGLGFEVKQFTQPVAELSVGWQMRVVLAKLLLQDADMYFFDEPTNHLDLPSKEWFCDYLERSAKGYLLISHDRYFLDNACEKIFEVERGALTQYEGNYSSYCDQKEHREAAQEAARIAQQKEISRMKETIAKFKSKASKAKMAQSMMKQLARIEIIESVVRRKRVSVPLPVPERAGSVVLKVDGLAKSFGDKHLFSDVTFEIERGKKVALVAPNGKGKTTLLNCLMGKVAADAGEVTFGHNVSVAVFEQEQVHVLKPNATVLEEVYGAASPEMREKVRMMLGCFLFSGDDVHKKTKVLSGGERNRVAMAKVLCKNANVLLLDEPTNHLDLASKEVLYKALQNYQGTIIFVSHDRDFIDHVSDTTLSLDNEKVSLFPGSYEEFCYQYPDRHSRIDDENSAGTGDGQKQGTLHKQASRELSKVERSIEKLEKEKERLEEVMGDHEYGSDAYMNALDRYEVIVSDLEGLQKKWDELSE